MWVIYVHYGIVIDLIMLWVWINYWGNISLRFYGNAEELSEILKICFLGIGECQYSVQVYKYCILEPNFLKQSVGCYYSH